MGKIYLAEKYSVARNFIVPALGGVLDPHVQFQRYKKYNKGYIVTKSNDIVTWCVGHLLSTDYEASGAGYWDYNKLPFISSLDKMTFIASEYAKAQVEVIGKLLKDYPTYSVVICTDEEREGELIGREILDFFNYKGLIERAWSNDSMTVSNMRNKLSNLYPSSQFDDLHLSAKLRQFSDFYVGINLTELATSIVDDGSTYSLGRIQTPLLCEIARREEAIDNFKEETFYRVKKDFVYSVDGNVNDISATIKLNDSDELSKIKDKSEVQSLERYLESMHQLKTPQVVITDEIVKKSSPPLFNLTDMQKHMNKVAGWNIEKTSDIADSLYKMGLATYPRTSGRHLSEDFSVRAKFTNIITEFVNKLAPANYPLQLDRDSVKAEVSKCGKRVFNNQALKDTDAAHDAYIIEQDYFNRLGELSDDQKLLANEVIKRMIQIVYCPIELNSRTFTYTLDCDGSFKINNTPITKAECSITSVKLLNQQGWTIFYPNDKVSGVQNEDIYDITLDSNTNPLFNIIEDKTKPPYYYKVISVLEWLEKNKLGTAATRGYYLGTLASRGYIYWDKGSIKVTDKGKFIYNIFKTTQFADEEATKILESHLKEIVDKNLTVDKYYEILLNLMKDSKQSLLDNKDKAKVSVVPNGNIVCRKCGSPMSVFEQYKGIRCTSCDFRVPGRIKSANLTEDQVIRLNNGEPVMVYNMLSVNKKKFSCKLQYDGMDLKFLFD